MVRVVNGLLGHREVCVKTHHKAGQSRDPECISRSW